MTTKDKSNEYRDAKDAFDTLELEDKAIFLMDAVFSTVLGGIEDVTSVVSDAVDDLIRRRDCDSDSNGSSNGDDASAGKAASTKTSARKRPAAKKKTAKKKSSTRKKDLDD